MQESYKALRDVIAERTNPVVAWVGAGLSSSAGLPMWRAMRDRLCEVVTAKSRDAADPAEKDRLSGIAKTAKEHNNLWVSFSILRDAGATTFRTTIRDCLKDAQRCAVPADYLRLWRLPIKGIVSFNLDPLAQRAHSEVRSGAHIHAFTSNEVGPLTHILKSSHPFLLHVHGRLEDESSWVFTQSEITALLADPAYRNFVAAILASSTVMFLGVTADDTAVASHFEVLRNQGIELGEHFWITSREDPQADRWAETAGVRAITYSAPSEDHSELSTILDSFLSHVSHDEEAPPHAPSRKSSALPALPDPVSILLLQPEEIRGVLNEHASMILSGHTEASIAEYSRFCREYDRAIYQSWYVTTTPPDNKLLGYEVLREVKQGAFGRVFEGTSTSGNRVAIKLLREDIRRRDEMLQSFRRGVQSMNILSRSGVEGMVPYIETSEIPAIAVMEYVEGPDLRDAVASGGISSWHDVVEVALQLATILREAHRLPERVLHRDVRPSNVMIQDLYTTSDEPQVVILDFDLSWYRGAIGVSVHDASTITGYLAPEQIAGAHSKSTRNALVDSYGLGMTLCFLRTGTDPAHLQHKHTDWEKKLYSDIRRFQCEQWVSAPTRYARLILCATRDDQSERWDMAQIQAELDQLSAAINAPESVNSIAFWTEEIVARAAGMLAIPHEHSWDLDGDNALIELPRGLAVRAHADEVTQAICVQIDWTGTGDERHETVRKYLPDMCRRAADALRKSGWSLDGSVKYKVDIATCKAEMPLRVVKAEHARAAEGLARAADEMTFS